MSAAVARPPRADRGIERIGGLQAPDLDRRAEPRRQVHADAVRAEDAGEGGGLGDVLRGEARGVGVDVREHRAVDAERRVGARVVGVAGRRVVRQRVPVPQRAARVAALHGAIQVVPVIEDPVAEARELDDRERANRLVGLEQAQESERPVEHAEVGAAGDDDRTAWPRVAPPWPRVRQTRVSRPCGSRSPRPPPVSGPRAGSRRRRSAMWWACRLSRCRRVPRRRRPERRGRGGPGARATVRRAWRAPWPSRRRRAGRSRRCRYCASSAALVTTG